VAELKTKKNNASVDAFLKGVADEQQRADARRVADLMREATGSPPAMWGGSIVGFGHYRCKYDSGRELDWFLTGFAPRKGNLTLYIMAGFDRYGEILGRLGKYKTGKSCLYVKRLADVDLAVLAELVRASVEHMTGIPKPAQPSESPKKKPKKARS
jgi:hypothetical protein